MYILHKTFNDLLVCDKCCEEIRDDEKIIKRLIDNEKSNQLYEAGIGYAKSMGYDAVGKPHAWAASSAADNYCR
jgi:predicted RNase H-related nuclease YkuK (DUF458 family)